MTIKSDSHYLNILLDPIKVCLDYRPKFGTSDAEGVSYNEFVNLFSSDTLYDALGLANKYVYAAHKASGGLTSFYRQLGIGCERVIREIIIDSFDVIPNKAIWSYQIVNEDGKSQTLSLDACIKYSDISSVNSLLLKGWIDRQAKRVGLDIVPNLGVVFEVRQGYKSADSKRQNADLRSSRKARENGLLFVMLIVSSQISSVVSQRYIASGIPVITADGNSDLESTLFFLKDILGFDLTNFLERNKKVISETTNSVVKSLLTPD